MEKIVRCILETPAAFLAFWNEHGPFNYGLSQGPQPDPNMVVDEWWFCNDRDTLIKAYFRWDELNIHMVWYEPSEAEQDEGPLPGWVAENFPNDDDYPLWFSPPQDVTPEEAELAFLDVCVEELNGDDLLRSLEDFTRSDKRRVFAQYLEDWQQEVDAKPLDTQGFIGLPNQSL